MPVNVISLSHEHEHETKRWAYVGKHEHMWAKIGDNQIWGSRTVKLLGITIDKELKFDWYVSNVCKRSQNKLTVLTRIKKYLGFNHFQSFS